MKAIISQPMNGKSEEQIRSERAETVKMLEGNGYEVVDTVFPDFSNQGNIPLKYLAKSLEAIADADVVFFMPGWNDARGCKIEHECCVEYGVSIEEAGASTVKMKKGDEVVNIRDTPEDIAKAKSLGYVMADTKPKQGTGKGADNGNGKNHDPNTVPAATNPPPSDPNAGAVQPPGGEKTGLAALYKKALFAFIGKRKLYDNSYKDLEPAAVVPLVLASVRNRIVEAKLKTAEEAAALPESDLIALFDTIK